MAARVDLAIVGGGLAGSLVALALHARHPELDCRLIEEGPALGGHHQWCFFGSDIANADRALVAPLIGHAWPSYRVAFPALRRTIAQPYYAIRSPRLDAVVRATLPAHAVMTGRRVLGVSANAVVLADGERIDAGGTIDARGPADLTQLDNGWQKFVGRDLTLARPHGTETPLVMDATVEQLDGYRFAYVLPTGECSIFVEDTYFSDTPDLDRARLTARIDAYAARQGWQVAAAGHEEAGVLPMSMGGDFEGYWRSGGKGVAKAGMRAGLFQPATGYSLPDAVRLASLIARQPDLSGGALHDVSYAFAKAAWRSRRFFRRLNTMLFRAAEPAERWRVMERFYRLNPRLIGRFYAGQSTMMDKVRILAGKPPVPVGRALAALRG